MSNPDHLCSAWLKDHEDPIIAHVSSKIKKMTNLTLETAEELQVFEYYTSNKKLRLLHEMID